MSNPFDFLAVLSRASDILKSGPLPDGWREHGEWCVWCAISKAKGELDSEHGISPPMGALFDIRGEREFESDIPLVLARRALAKWNDIDPMTLKQAGALSILAEAATVTPEQGRSVIPDRRERPRLWYVANKNA